MKGKIIDSDISEALILFEDFSIMNMPLNKISSTSRNGDKANINKSNSSSCSKIRNLDFI